MSLHGRYSPRFPHKYVGNPNNIVFRSGWERTFMEYCDNNSSIVSWSSEELFVPYYLVTDRKWHRYFPDFLINIKTKEGPVVTWLVEIKPQSQTRHPGTKKFSSNRRQLKEALEYEKNQAKWTAANAYCQARGWQFKILTERDLYPNG